MMKSLFFVFFPKVCEANILGAFTTASCLFTTTTITVKNYLLSCWVVSKPFALAGFVKTGWLTMMSMMEWYSGYMYSKNCIGEGINGWWNHHWTIGSPACVSLLSTHVALMGVFLATFLVTILAWLIWFGAKFREDKSAKEIEKVINIEKLKKERKVTFNEKQ